MEVIKGLLKYNCVSYIDMEIGLTGRCRQVRHGLMVSMVPMTSGCKEHISPSLITIQYIFHMHIYM